MAAPRAAQSARRQREDEAARSTVAEREVEGGRAGESRGKALPEDRAGLRQRKRAGGVDLKTWGNFSEEPP